MQYHTIKSNWEAIMGLLQLPHSEAKIKQWNRLLYLLLWYKFSNMSYKIPDLPLSFDVETKAVLKQTIEANRRLAELKGVVKSMPNASILINTLALQEAKDSSAIESIITTHDELYKAELFVHQFTSAGAKEVQMRP